MTIHINLSALSKMNRTKKTYIRTTAEHFIELRHASSTVGKQMFQSCSNTSHPVPRLFGIARPDSTQQALCGLVPHIDARTCTVQFSIHSLETIKITHRKLVTWFDRLRKSIFFSIICNFAKGPACNEQ
jgi:hypothetical protein